MAHFAHDSVTDRRSEGAEGVQVHPRHGPAFAVVRLLLTSGEAMCLDGGSVVACSYGVTTQAPGRKVNGRSRSLVLTAPEAGGWADVAPQTFGDVYPLELDGRAGWCVARDSVLVYARTVSRDPQWPGFHSLFGGEAGFLEHWSGLGSVALVCAGAVDMLSLQQGELITVEPRHLLAYPDGMQCRIRAVGQSAPQSLRTGDGLAVDFAGPGHVLLHTRTG